jgi:hypothetical protein
MDGQWWFSWSAFRWWLRCKAGLRPCSRLVAWADDGGARWRRYLPKGVVEAVACSSTWENSGGNLRSHRGSDEGGVWRHSLLGASFLESALIGGTCGSWWSLEAVVCACRGSGLGNHGGSSFGKVIGSVDSSQRR